MILQRNPSSNTSSGRIWRRHRWCITTKMNSLFYFAYTQQHGKRNYAKIEKECLAIVSCMDKWHQYLYDKHDITVHTDHQPLETIFKKATQQSPSQVAKNDAKIAEISIHSPVQEGERAVRSGYSRARGPWLSPILTTPPLLTSRNVKSFDWNWRKWISHQIGLQPTL